MEQWSASAEAHRPAVRRTDRWVKLSLAVVSISLVWTAIVFLVASLSDPCASSRDQCVFALAAAVAWICPQAIVVPLQVIAVVVLTRYALQGNRGVTAAGLTLFAVNCALTGWLFWYLTMLPFYFR